MLGLVPHSHGRQAGMLTQLSHLRPGFCEQRCRSPQSMNAGMTWRQRPGKGWVHSHTKLRHAGVQSTQSAAATVSTPAPAPASPNAWTFPPVSINGVKLPGWSLPKLPPAPPASPLAPAPQPTYVPQVIISEHSMLCKCETVHLSILHASV